MTARLALSYAPLRRQPEEGQIVDAPGTFAAPSYALNDPFAAVARRRWLWSRIVIYGLLTVFAAVYVFPLLLIAVGVLVLRRQS